MCCNNQLLWSLVRKFHWKTYKVNANLTGCLWYKFIHSFVQPFIHGIITQNTNHRNILHLFRDHSASLSIGKGKGKDKEINRKLYRKDGVQSKKWCSSHKFSYILFSVTQFFLLAFSWSSDNITVSKKNTSKKEPASISEITISYLQKNIIISLLCQCGLFIHTCVSRNSVLSQDVIFYLLWYNLMRWSRHICKKILFSLIL